MSKDFVENKIGRLPADWKVQVLSSFASVKDGTHHTPTYLDAGIPFLRVTDIHSSEIDFSKIKFVSQEEHQGLIKRCHPKKGDILYSKNGTVGIPRIVDWEWEFSIFVSLALLKIKKQNAIDLRYFFYYLGSDLAKKEIYRSSKQGTVTNLHLEEIKKFRVPVPPLPEQRKIAAILSIWDEAIAKTEQLIAALHRRKKGLMQRLLSGEVRFKGFDGAWRETTLAEFLTPFSKKNTGNEDLTALSCSTIYGIVPQTMIFDKRIASKDTRRYKVVERGDLIYDPMLLWDASIGFLEILERGVISPAYSTFKFREENGNRTYFKYLLKTHYYREHYKYISQGTNVRRRKAPIDAFLNLRVTLPPSRAEQDKIAAILQASDAEIELHQQKLAALKKQKQGLMQRLLTGTVRLKAPEN